MKLNIQIELDIEEFRYDDARLSRILTGIANIALDNTGEKPITDIEIKTLWGEFPTKKIGWWNISQ